METQQIITLRNNTVRKIENRGMNKLLEEEAMDEILLFASDFPSHEDEAVDLLLDVITAEHTSNRAPIIDMDLIHWAINRLRGADRASANSRHQVAYLESLILERRDSIILDLMDGDHVEMWMDMRQLPPNDLNRYENFPFRASKSAIQALPNVFTTDGFSSSWVCAVCLDDQIEANDGAKQLPCKHIFHTHYIVSWLELHNSCPLCQCQLPT